MTVTVASAAYAQWVQELIDQGFTPYLITFMFKPLPGSPASKRAQMKSIIERAYGSYLTRQVRRPHSTLAGGLRPVWIVASDEPVYKHEKQRLRDVTINDGAHEQGFALEPPIRRRPEPLDQHFVAFQTFYRKRCAGLETIHAKPITHDVVRVADYLMKTVERGEKADDGYGPVQAFGDRVTGDDILILPRTSAEAKRRATPRLNG